MTSPPISTKQCFSPTNHMFSANLPLNILSSDVDHIVGSNRVPNYTYFFPYPSTSPDTFFFLFSCSFSPLSSSSDVTPVTPVTPCYIPYTLLLQPCYTLLHPCYTLLHPGYTRLHPPVLPFTNYFTSCYIPVTPLYYLLHYVISPICPVKAPLHTVTPPLHPLMREGNDWTWVK